MKNTLLTFLLLMALLLGWELFSFFNHDYILVLPAPSQVLIRLWQKADRFWFHTSVTLKEMLCGFALAISVAFPLAWVMDRFLMARSVLQPFFIVTQCIPMFTLAPIMVVWFGWSFTAIVIPTALMIFFPLTITIYQGLRSVPKDLQEYFSFNQATSWQLFYKLKLPWALPHLFSGFRLAAALAGVAAVAGEWAGGQAGLGVLMVESRRDMDLETNFAALLCLTLISYTLYWVTLCGERLVLERRPLNILVRKWFHSRVVWSLFCLATIGGIILAGCHRKTDQVRLVLDWLPNPNHIPLYVGIHKGFFEDEGIPLSIQKLQEPCHATSYLLLDQCELALAYMPHTIRAFQKGGQIEPVGLLIQEPLNAFIFREEEGIEEPKDLNGKRFGFCTGGKEAVFLNALLKSNQLVSKEQVNVACDMVTALATKKVDVLYGAYWNIETEHMRSLGLSTRFFKLSQFGIPTYYELIILAKKETIYVEEAFVRKFKKALQKSIDYSRVHPDEAFALYSLYQPDKSEKTRAWELAAWKQTLPVLADQQILSQEVWQAFEAWMKAHHLL